MQRVNIIIVDDEIEALTTFLCSIVDNKALSYTFFNKNLDSAIDYVKTNVVHCAFLDIKMNEMDGLTLAHKLIEINPKIKIVFITGFTYSEDAIKAEFKDNFLAFIYKPFDEEKLHYVLGKLQNNQEVMIQTLAPSVNVLIGLIPIKFISTKSKELFAYALSSRGRTIPMDEVINRLWPQSEEELAKRLYRDAVYKLRLTLNEYNLVGLVDFSRARLAFNMHYPNLHFDFPQLLDEGNIEYPDNYLTNYQWSQSLKD